MNNNLIVKKEIMDFIVELYSYKKKDPVIASLFPEALAGGDEEKILAPQDIKDIYDNLLKNIHQEKKNLKSRITEICTKILSLQEEIGKRQLVLDHPEQSHLANSDPEIIRHYTTYYTNRLPQQRQELLALHNE